MSEKILFNSEESALMLQAVEPGARFFAKVYETHISKKEIEALKSVIASGKDVPQLALRMVCLGLEVMYWLWEEHPEGIPALLSKLENICSYKRCGMELQSGGILLV